jgi:hypothetical protein
MSVVEDTRKLLQDFLAPELRELKGRIDSLGIRMDMLEIKLQMGRNEHAELRGTQRQTQSSAQSTLDRAAARKA